MGKPPAVQAQAQGSTDQRLYELVGSRGQHTVTRTKAHRSRHVQKARKLCQGSVSEVDRVQERHRKGSPEANNTQGVQ